MKRLAALALALVACSSEPEVTVPVKPAPASRHAALRDGLLADSADAPPATGPAFAFLAHQAPVVPRSIDSVDVALGAVEYAATTADLSVVAAIDEVVARFDTTAYAETTVATARIALLDVEVTRLLGQDRRARAIARDDAIRARAFGDLADPATGGQARAYAASPSEPFTSGPANVAMLILKSRLYRLTKDDVFRLEARAIFGALASYVPASLEEEAELGFAAALLFEITGEDRFIAASDAVFDAIAVRRGTGFSNTTCAGCAFHALWSLGYRRGLAGEAF